MGEKTEKATPKKLRDAKKKGQVAKAQDLPSAFTFIASIAIVLGMSDMLYHQLAGFIVATFKLVPQADLGKIIAQLYFQSITVIFMCSIPILAFVSFVGFVVTFGTVGPVFAPEVFKFDIKKFDPISNLKGKFKMKTLVELLKSMAKIFVASYIIYLVMYKSIPVLIQTISLPISGSLLIFYHFLMEVVTKVGLFFVVIAIADFVYQKKNFAKEMKMEKFETKQEYKNTEGDPHIKGKRKQIAQEIAYSEGPGGGVSRSQAVITNPTHLAIAVAYKKDVDAAPYIVTMGSGELAERIVKFAHEFNIPVIRNISLAHNLWENGEIFEFIPEDAYEPIATVLRYCEKMQMKLETGVDVDEE